MFMREIHLYADVCASMSVCLHMCVEALRQPPVLFIRNAIHFFDTISLICLEITN